MPSAPWTRSKPGYQSVLSQLAAAIVGRGTIYDVAIGSVLAVLCLSANTSFVGFPRLCRLLARDRYLPHSFAMPGRRLVYSLGILFLAAAAGILLVAFDGITDRLIPLFAVGAFLSFTLSQAGMAMHWTKALRESGSSRVQLKRFVNGAGHDRHRHRAGHHHRREVCRGRLDHHRFDPAAILADANDPPALRHGSAAVALWSRSKTWRSIIRRR